MKTGMKILFVTKKDTHCGVADYGIRLFNILKKAFDIQLCEIDENRRIAQNIEEYDTILYNYHFATLPFINDDFLRGNLAKHVVIFHEAHIEFTPDKIIDTSIRPLFEDFAVQVKQRTSSAPIIGSFGFGFPDKDFPRVAQLVSDQFSEATLRLNIPFAHYGDRDGQLAQREADKVRTICHKGIRVEITYNYLTHTNLLNWLHHNDLNLFLYKPSSGRGYASATDYALSVKKPIGVSDSEMFRHLPESIRVSNCSLKELIEKGTEPLEQVYKDHSNSKLIERFKALLV